MATLHAVRQLVRHLRARQPLAAPTWLMADEAGLFRRMAPPDQLEGLAVAGTLEAWGWGADRDLLLAGVLHDLGKSLAPPGARYRVLMTTVETLLPAQLGRAGEAPAAAVVLLTTLERLLPALLPPLAGGGSALAALAGHADAGGKLAAEAGLPGDVVRLIAQHHQPAQDARMLALQRADALH